MIGYPKRLWRMSPCVPIFCSCKSLYLTYSGHIGWHGGHVTSRASCTYIPHLAAETLLAISISTAPPITSLRRSYQPTKAIRMRSTKPRSRTPSAPPNPGRNSWKSESPLSQLRTTSSIPRRSGAGSTLPQIRPATTRDREEWILGRSGRSKRRGGGGGRASQTSGASRLWARDAGEWGGSLAKHTSAVGDSCGCALCEHSVAHCTK